MAKARFTTELIEGHGGGWIGQRWGRHFLIVDEALRRAANVKVGDAVAVVVEPTTRAQAMAKARAQAPLTTKPGKRKRAR